MTMASNRSYFTPTEVPDEVSLSARRCVDACTTFLGHTELKGAPWSVDTLRGISPKGSVLRSLNNLDDIMPHLDNLYVAIMNKNGGIVGHSVVLYRSEDQMGTTKCHLFNPGGSGRPTSSTIDLSRKRDTSGWNYICAVFIPGTVIPAQASDTVDLTGSDSDEDGLRGSDGAAATSRTSSSSSTPASQSQTASTQRTLSGRSMSPPMTASGNGVNEYSPTRRQPPRATKNRPKKSLFYNERQSETAREDYHRVDHDHYGSSSDQFPDQCTKEMIGQHVARYLLNTRKWVVWFRLSTSEYVIAKSEAFSGYNIEDAELGLDRFVGYTSLAEWAFQEGIYEKSIRNADGEVFLEAVGLWDDPYKLFSTSNGRKRRKISVDGAQKKMKKLGDQLVADFEEHEEEQRALEAQASADAKPAAARDSSDDEASTKSSDSEHTDEEGINHFSEGDYGASHDDEDDESAAKEEDKEQDEELSLDNEDEHNASQEKEGEEQEEGETEAVKQAIFNELKELNTEVANLKAELDAKNKELESAHDKNNRLAQELAQESDKIEQMRKILS